MALVISNWFPLYSCAFIHLKTLFPEGFHWDHGFAWLHGQKGRCGAGAVSQAVLHLSEGPHAPAFYDALKRSSVHQLPTMASVSGGSGVHLVFCSGNQLGCYLTWRLGWSGICS